MKRTNQAVVAKDPIPRHTAEEYGQFIADAFNVLHETGLTPRELVEQRGELKRTIHEVEPVLAEFEDDMPEEIDKLKWALSKLRATGK